MINVVCVILIIIVQNNLGEILIKYSKFSEKMLRIFDKVWYS